MLHNILFDQSLSVSVSTSPLCLHRSLWQATATKLRLCVTNGSQEAAARAMEMLLEPGQDAVLLESPTYR